MSFRALPRSGSHWKPLLKQCGHAFDLGRKVLVLTERTEHLDAIKAAISGVSSLLFCVIWRMSKNGGQYYRTRALPSGYQRGY